MREMSLRMQVGGAMMRLEEGAVENIMDFRGRGKGQSVSYGAHGFNDLEGTIVVIRKFVESGPGD